jgi:uncharacterized protein (DUF924 family)
MKSPQEVLDFWFTTERPPHYRPQWFVKSKSFDDEIRQNFLQLHQGVRAGHYTEWLKTAEGTLAAVIVLDQFSRNMFRDTPQAFESDAMALHLTREAIISEKDLELDPVQRWFLYLPLEHSENLRDQEISVEIFADLQTQLPNTKVLEYAEKHRDVIARFGRFPHRNSILGRKSTPEEIDFMKHVRAGF